MEKGSFIAEILSVLAISIVLVSAIMVINQPKPSVFNEDYTFNINPTTREPYQMCYPNDDLVFRLKDKDGNVVVTTSVIERQLKKQKEEYDV